jgi:hypothetical protein
MNTTRRLDTLRKNPPLRIKLTGPAVVFSDTHWGDGTKVDHFWPVHEKFEKVVFDYKARGFTTIINGDWKDLWKFNWITKYGIIFDYAIGGNHDRRLGNPEAAIIECSGGEIFIAHGHQGEYLCDEGAGISEEVIEHIWKHLEELGLSESSDDRHAEQHKRLVEWANKQDVPCIFSHIHYLEHNDKYWNSGYGCRFERVEIDNINRELKLVN